MLCEQAASTSPEAQPPIPIVHYVIDHHTFVEQLDAMLEGRRAVFDVSDPLRVRCHGADGCPADPADVVAAALLRCGGSLSAAMG